MPLRTSTSTDDPFWKSARVLLRYKGPLALALVGALISAGCFGAGLSMLLGVFHLFLAQKHDLPGLIRQYLAPPTASAWRNQLAEYLAQSVPTDPFLAFLSILLVIAVLTVIGSAGRYLHEYLTLTVCHRAAMYWRTRLFHRLLHARPVELLARGSSDHISRLTIDTTSLIQGYQAILGRGVADVTKGAAALAGAVLLDWRLTLLALIAAPLLAYMLRKFGRRIRRAADAALSERARLLAVLREVARGLVVVKVHNAEGYERRRFSRVNRSLFQQEMKARQAKALASPIVETVTLLAVMLVAAVAAWYIFRRQIPAERFMTVLAMLVAAGASLRPLTQMFTHIKEAEAAAARILQSLQLPVEPIGPEAPLYLPALPRHHREIVFDQVSYTYPGSAQPALQDVSLSVPFGLTVAIVGPNGSGKTTLVNLLPRLFDPTAGRVLIDGMDIRQVSLRSLRRQIALVTQQTILFQGTIAENIAYGRRHEPLQRIIAAAQAARADEFIRQLPLGYDTPLGEDGSGLSGGQRQRLCIARAILRDPAILILDEATSQIDPDSEAQIAAALNAFRRGRTTFIIAHRLSTVIDADLIVVMNAGRIVDQGSHSQLLERCPHYRTLTQTQLLPAGL